MPADRPSGLQDEGRSVQTPLQIGRGDGPANLTKAKEVLPLTPNVKMAHALPYHFRSIASSISIGRKLRIRKGERSGKVGRGGERGNFSRLLQGNFA